LSASKSLWGAENRSRSAYHEADRADLAGRRRRRRRRRRLPAKASAH
jgi:hypothetical protein